MLRSFSYAANVTMLSAIDEGRGRVEQLAGPARHWEASVSRAFLRAYRESIAAARVVPVEDAAFDRLLDTFMLEKVLYELDYELASRPQWIRIPLLGLLHILDLDRTAGAPDLQVRGGPRA
jgi:maltose alpha-D-glucosyltransferase/alpha-amylase